MNMKLCTVRVSRKTAVHSMFGKERRLDGLLVQGALKMPTCKFGRLTPQPHSGLLYQTKYLNTPYSSLWTVSTGGLPLNRIYVLCICILKLFVDLLEQVQKYVHVSGLRQSTRCSLWFRIPQSTHIDCSFIYRFPFIHI